MEEQRFGERNGALEFGGGGGQAAEGEEEELESQLRCLDLTSFQLRDLSEIEITEDLVELDLNANRLSKLDQRIALLSQLRKLSLRQNLFDDDGIEPISRWNALAGLIEIVFRDNRLRNIPDVSIFKSLLVFDVSFNQIASLNGLSKISNTLKELYLSNNEIKKMEELEHFHLLQILELGSNRLRECIMLEELYLSHNGIQKMEGLSTLENLHILDISSNKLTAIGDIEKLTRLEDLWLNDNQIASLEDIDLAVSGSREKLTTIYLERNPCASLPNYSSTLRQIFPNLQQIDSDIFM
ncbi:protein phosphatase 1 regulatory inhibitor subunit PPP1R7 homolog isoform X3 [Zingiber officinale]|uniref:protein phosphatase 1 regulatory inhibitor subunit PPP1R7 homolog isoform X3 n=1 Tax=Zingiber officinale TaxID=94328 RepID=UPI001C4BB056|nr:protein phosphatase 1 regulatory inhibitor subunit PPP1R7 homolog isoform X3 [Zingiber officinale]